MEGGAVLRENEAMSGGRNQPLRYRFGLRHDLMWRANMVDKSGNPAIDSVAEQARSAVDRVAERATGAVNTAKASIHQKVDTVADRANAASQWASDRVDAAKKAPTDALEAGAEYIRARPYAAVGAALALGYLIGKLR
jgi:ElaB/YqjD/DUF883 family membrane-anchored ribosome-binding protein